MTSSSRSSGLIYYLASERFLVSAASIAAFSGLTYVGALIRIPLYPVPLTLQTLFVLLAGAVLGGRRGSASEILYISLGAMGLPVFAAQTSGFSVLTGPTGGYIMGFIIAPILIGRLLKRRTSLGWILSVFSLGTLVILSMGIIHLTLFYTHNISRALLVGFFPFIPGDLLKILAATSIYRSYIGLLRTRNKARGKP